ncbi:hypothetical protein C3K47_09645 [Solitalea longa]|uniref:Uncharacterized protein n=1 Tax=Solitalea longa TaxID=2079460 RepID=A0A2S5A2V8_9SPHI|nr:hypothetical protein [Solitalea longa]POY36627.1 hypothetical protein C3K47_09645 [Solitalea longa]
MKYLLVLISFLSIRAYGTPPDYVVYYTTGKCLKKTGGKTEVVKKGDKLLASDQLVLSNDSRLVLICKNFKAIQLTQKNLKSLKSLTDCSNEGSSLTSSYFKYVWAEFTHPHGSPEKDPRHYMKNVGAVNRGCPLLQTLVSIDTIHYYNDKLLVRWEPSNASFVTSFYSDAIDGRLLYTHNLSGNSIRIENVLKNWDIGEYYWELAPENNIPCQRNYLRIWNEKDYRNAVNALLSTVVPTSAAETAYMQGYILEENHFLVDAAKKYLKAFELEPTNQLYKNTQAKFYE